MTIHSSLNIGGGIQRHRNVLTRAEKIAKLAEQGKFDPESGDPLKLPKVGHRKLVTGKKKKKGPATEEAS
ncbi:MAG: small basic protein [Planctomycetota bacterium]